VGCVRTFVCLGVEIKSILADVFLWGVEGGVEEGFVVDAAFAAVDVADDAVEASSTVYFVSIEGLRHWPMMNMLFE